MTIRRFQEGDLAAWMRMRLALWPAIADEDGEADARRWLAREDAFVMVAETAGGELVGFVEAGERAYAEGCSTEPVAFWRDGGWPAFRRPGIGRARVKAALVWAGERGLVEFASDAPLKNVESHLAHAAAGFAEVQRAVQFRRVIGT